MFFCTLQQQQKELAVKTSAMRQSLHHQHTMIELDALIVVWAVKQCCIYLLALRTSRSTIIDHKPLIPVFNSYTFNQIESQRLKVKLQLLDFTAEWQEVKEHAILGTLSCAPVQDSTRQHIQWPEGGQGAGLVHSLQCGDAQQRGQQVQATI